MSVRAAIRRVLGVLLTLVAVSVGVFWAAATFDSRGAGRRASPFAGLPVFFNAHPIGVRELATAAVRQIAHGGTQAAGAELSLARLGGAALPYVLPALDSLEPRGRERVALALTPIALRMEVANADELEDGAQAVLFWTRFWQDRAIDFRAASVRHLTTRLAERSIALRREDLIHVDTFALPALIEGLGSVVTTEDVERVQRLNSVLAHVTDLPLRSSPGASIVQAQRTVDVWRDFWELHGSEYSVLDGPRRLAATFVETQYGKWLAAVLRGGLGRTRSGESALALVRHGLATTAFLLLVGLGAGFPLGVAWTRFERRTRRFAGRYASAIVGTALAAIPCATFVRLFAGLGGGIFCAICLVTLTTAAWVSRHLARSTMSQSVSPIAAAFSVSAPLGATCPPFVLSAIVLVELSLQLPGLGRSAALALASGDVNAWMATSLALAFATLLLRQAADPDSPSGGNDEAAVTRELSAQRRLALAAGATALLIFVAAALAPLSPELRAYARGLQFAVLAGLLIMSVAFLVAIPLGTLAASGPRVFDAALRFVSDSVSSLPTVFVAAVFWAWSDRSSSYVCALGALRGLEQAWLLRCEIVRLEAEDPESVPHGLGRTPLSAFLRQRLPAALGPLFVSASFSVAWLTAVDAALTQAGLRPKAALATWGIPLGAPHPSPLPALLAAGSVALLTVALHALFRPPAAA